MIVANDGEEFEEPIGSPPSTPVLYNLIRNEGSPKFMMQRAMAEKGDLEEKDLVVVTPGMIPTSPPPLSSRFNPGLIGREYRGFGGGDASWTSKCLPFCR
jgi:hypothetical protein